MALLAFAGLFIFDQLATLKFKYMAPRDAYFERYLKKKNRKLINIARVPSTLLLSLARNFSPGVIV